MAETMVERVAEAILERLKTAQAVYQEPPMIMGDVDDVVIDGCVDLRLVARAAIEAMREPTDLMGLGLDKMGGEYRPGSHSATKIWRAMIDAALTEPKAEGIKAGGEQGIAS